MAERRGGWRRIGRWAGIAAALGLAVLLLLAAGLAWRLSNGPLPLTWLTPAIERALTPDHSLRVAIARTELRLGDRRLVELVARDVTASEPDGTVVIELSAVALALSSRALLGHAMLAPARLEVAAPRLRLQRRADGRIALQSAPAGSAVRGKLDPVGLLTGLFVPRGADQPLAYLREVRITGGVVEIADAASRRTLTLDSLDLTLRRERRGWPGFGAGPGPSSPSAAGISAPESSGPGSSIPAASAPAAPDRDVADRDVAGRSGAGRAGAGVLVALEVGIRQQAVPASLGLTGRFDPASGWLEARAALAGLRPAAFAAFAPAVPLAGLDLPLGGQITTRIHVDGRRAPLVFDLHGGAGALALPGLIAGPLAVDALVVAGELASDFGALSLARLELESAQGRLSGHGRLAWRDGLAAELDLTLGALRTADLAQLWPAALAPAARAWLLDHVSGGTLPEAELALRLAPGDLAVRPLPAAALRLHP